MPGAVRKSNTIEKIRGYFLEKTATALLLGTNRKEIKDHDINVLIYETRGDFNNQDKG